MANPIIASPVLSDAGTILTASTVSASAPGSLLQDMQPSIPAIFTVPGAIVIEVDLLSAQSINLVWLGYTTLSATATWRIRAASSQANLTASPIYDSNSVTAIPSAEALTWERPHALKFLTSPVTARYWRIDIGDSANSKGQVSIGRLYIAKAFQASKGAKAGSPSFPMQETARFNESMDGNIFPRQSSVRGGLTFSLEYLTKAEMLGELGKIRRTRGVSQDVLVILDPDESTYIMDFTTYGLFREMSTFEIPTLNYYSASIAVDEIN